MLHLTLIQIFNLISSLHFCFNHTSHDLHSVEKVYTHTTSNFLGTYSISPKSNTTKTPPRTMELTPTPAPCGRWLPSPIAKGTISGWWRSKRRLSEKCVRRLVDKQQEVNTNRTSWKRQQRARDVGRDLQMRGKPLGGHQTWY